MKGLAHRLRRWWCGVWLPTAAMERKRLERRIDLMESAWRELREIVEHPWSERDPYNAQGRLDELRLLVADYEQRRKDAPI